MLNNNECTLIILSATHAVSLCAFVVKRNHTAHLVNSNSGWRISKLYRISFCLSLSSCYQTYTLQIRKQISHLKSLAVVFSFQAQIHHQKQQIKSREKITNQPYDNHQKAYVVVVIIANKIKSLSNNLRIGGIEKERQYIFVFQWP